jgi:nucleoside-diphosphate-sugar epimerase
MDWIHITGSRGFIGKELMSALDGYHIDETAATIDFDALNGNTGVLIHLAGSISDTESFINPEKYIENNIKKLARLLISNSFCKIIFPSSVTVYDSSGNLNPRTVYGITKLAAELLIKAYCRNYWILRITNPYGPNDTKSVFAKLKECKLNNKIFTIYNDPKSVKDFFHVSHISSVVKDILSDKISPGTYNVGSGRATNVMSLLETLCQKHGIMYEYAYPPPGLSIGYVPTENLLTHEHRNVEDEWIKYLS